LPYPQGRWWTVCFRVCEVIFFFFLTSLGARPVVRPATIWSFGSESYLPGVTRCLPATAHRRLFRPAACFFFSSFAPDHAFFPPPHPPSTKSPFFPPPLVLACRLTPRRTENDVVRPLFHPDLFSFFFYQCIRSPRSSLGIKGGWAFPPFRLPDFFAYRSRVSSFLFAAIRFFWAHSDDNLFFL